ncbi:ATP synthase subunit I [Hoeflea sp. EC-HK425]|uniref:ATP synthase subunit I n=1 Tax=Hoeflea sp. EC-HK425 TaxID=2038388 RepID=UPI00125B29C2|nr:ATP synthase subunit I [Hoeflea sp. EC-HK425]VVT00124.1 conserved membrane hypothetical protein [Hoeflea sp. EC-HK425]
MTGMDWGALTTGLAIGAAMGAFYFVGLAFGMRVALASAGPTTTLMLSAAMRIALLLAAGWAVGQTGTWTLVGYALAFLIVRLVVVTLARRLPMEPKGWN